MTKKNDVKATTTASPDRAQGDASRTKETLPSSSKKVPSRPPTSKPEELESAAANKGAAVQEQGPAVHDQGPSAQERGGEAGEAPVETAIKPVRSRAAAGWIVLFSIFLLAGVAVATWDLWRPNLRQGLEDPSMALSPDDAKQADALAPLAAFSEQVAALQDLVESQSRKLSEIVASSSGEAQTLKSLDQRLTGVEESLSAVSANPAASTAAIDFLTNRVAALEKAVGESAGMKARDSALLIAAGQLREALRTSQPYHQEFEAMRALSAGDARIEANLDPLAGNAEMGIPTLEVLRAEFETVASNAVRATSLSDDSGISAWLRGRLAELISVRRTGADLPGATAEAIVARAEIHLQAGDLRAAVAELEGLDGAAAEAARRWLAGARARLEAERSLREITAYVIERLSGGDAPAETAEEGK